jgi:hypothetical protein
MNGFDTISPPGRISRQPNKESIPFQARLTINNPNDQYEMEADNVTGMKESEPDISTLSWDWDLPPVSLTLKLQ